MTMAKTQTDSLSLPLNRATAKQVAAVLPPDFFKTLLADLAPAFARRERVESQMQRVNLSWDDVGDDAQLSWAELEMDLARTRQEQRELALARLNETKSRAGYAPGCDPDAPKTPATWILGYITRNPMPRGLFHKRKEGSGEPLDLESERWLKDFAAVPYVRRIGARAAWRALKSAGANIGLSAVNRRVRV